MSAPQPPYGQFGSGQNDNRRPSSGPLDKNQVRVVKFQSARTGSLRKRPPSGGLSSCMTLRSPLVPGLGCSAEWPLVEIGLKAKK
jgi:hypothetical protein